MAVEGSQESPNPKVPPGPYDHLPVNTLSYWGTEGQDLLQAPGLINPQVSLETTSLYGFTVNGRSYSRKEPRPEYSPFPIVLCLNGILDCVNSGQTVLIGSDILNILEEAGIKRTNWRPEWFVERDVLRPLYVSDKEERATYNIARFEIFDPRNKTDVEAAVTLGGLRNILLEVGSPSASHHPSTAKRAPDKSWQDYSNCLGVDPDIFFPERGASTREAKEVCRGCLVRGDCLEYSLANGEKFGIWGGMSERERRRIRRQRSLAREA